jgi:hypothetical protein
MMPNGLPDRQLTLMEVDIELNLTPFPDLSSRETIYALRFIRNILHDYRYDNSDGF